MVSPLSCNCSTLQFSYSLQIVSSLPHLRWFSASYFGRIVAMTFLLRLPFLSSPILFPHFYMTYGVGVNKKNIHCLIKTITADRSLSAFTEKNQHEMYLPHPLPLLRGRTDAGFEVADTRLTLRMLHSRRPSIQLD